MYHTRKVKCMIGAVCYGIGTFVTLRSGMASFESTCHAVDGLIDKYIDINTILPVFKDKDFARITLRSKSERMLFHSFYDIVFRLCDMYCEERGIDMPKFSIHGLQRAVDREDDTYQKIVDAMFTHVCKIGQGDTSWVSTRDDQIIHAWMQENISLEDRLTIQSAMILMSDLAENGRLG